MRRAVVSSHASLYNATIGSIYGNTFKLQRGQSGALEYLEIVHEVTGENSKGAEVGNAPSLPQEQQLVEGLQPKEAFRELCTVSCSIHLSLNHAGW